MLSLVLPLLSPGFCRGLVLTPPPLGSSSLWGQPGGVVAPSEVLGMRKKYDELVSYTVNLTAERDRLKTVRQSLHSRRRMDLETERAYADTRGHG